jgi:methionyl aminopeptidase
LNGFYSDAARTYGVGKVSAQAQKIMSAVEECFWAGVEGKKAGDRIGDIAYDIQQCAESKGFGIVRDFVGHGIGRQLHEDPAVPNFGKKGTGLKMQKGLALAIEPMITQGSWQVQILPDGWTAVTTDGQLSAHHEETVIVLEDRVEVLTACPKKTPSKLKAR